MVLLQLESLERRSSGSQAYKKSAANAMARLNSLSQRASLARETSGSEPSNPSASVSPEVQSLERTRGEHATGLAASLRLPKSLLCQVLRQYTADTALTIIIQMAAKQF